MKKTIRNDAPPPPPKYPCLMISEVTGVIVLFRSPCSGTVMAESTNEDYLGCNCIGDYLGLWSRENFKTYHGTLTLSN